jgi:hypothetical protein
MPLYTSGHSFTASHHPAASDHPEYSAHLLSDITVGLGAALKEENFWQTF